MGRGVGEEKSIRSFHQCAGSSFAFFVYVSVRAVLRIATLRDRVVSSPVWALVSDLTPLPPEIVHVGPGPLVSVESVSFHGASHSQTRPRGRSPSFQ